MISRTPAPPYFAVIFTSQLGPNGDGYDDMASRMADLAAEQPGFLGIESVRDSSGFGITVSYWANEAAIAAWRAHAEHAVAQKLGRARWYRDYHIRVARVERAAARDA